MLEEEVHPGQDRQPIGQNREVAAGVLPLGCFCSCATLGVWDRQEFRLCTGPLGPE